MALRAYFLLPGRSPLQPQYPMHCRLCGKGICCEDETRIFSRYLPGIQKVWRSEILRRVIFDSSFCSIIFALLFAEDVCQDHPEYKSRGDATDERYDADEDGDRVGVGLYPVFPKFESDKDEEAAKDTIGDQGQDFRGCKGDCKSDDDEPGDDVCPAVRAPNLYMAASPPAPWHIGNRRAGQ